MDNVSREMTFEEESRAYLQEIKTLALEKEMRNNNVLVWSNRWVVLGWIVSFDYSIVV